MQSRAWFAASALGAALVTGAGRARAEVPAAKIAVAPLDPTDQRVRYATRKKDVHAVRRRWGAGRSVTAVGVSVGTLGLLILGGAEIARAQARPGTHDGIILAEVVSVPLLIGGGLLLAIGIPLLATTPSPDRLPQHLLVPTVAVGNRSLSLRWSF